MINDIMINLLFLLYQTLRTPQLLLGIISVSLCVKSYFLATLVSYSTRYRKVSAPLILLIGILTGSLFGDIAWVAKLSHELFLPASSFGMVTFVIRIAWAMLILQYQSLVLFAQSLIQRTFKPNRGQQITIVCSIMFFLYFMYTALFDTTLISPYDRAAARTGLTAIPLEITIMRYLVYYSLNLLILPEIYFTWQKLRTITLPKIIRKQCSIFLSFLWIPYITLEFIQGTYFIFHASQDALYPVVSCSTILITYTIYYCMNQVMNLRFLNIFDHVQSPPRANAVIHFKHALDVMSRASNVEELNQIIKAFFNDAFGIADQYTTLYIRQINPASGQQSPVKQAEPRIESFLSMHSDIVKNHKILIYDEVACSNFYQETEQNKTVLSLLETMQIGVFLPLYSRNKIIAYITISNHARPNKCYSNIERDEMLVFATYLGNVLHLLQNRNIETLMQQEKELEEELYKKTMETNQYKESIRSFLRNQKQKVPGIVFYKQRRFIFGNQAAKELVQINLNTHEGHPLVKEIKQIAQQVEQYKAPQTRFAKDTHGNTLVLSAVPHLEQHAVIIMICHPGIADIITKQIDHLHDPTRWDYLLYLETTQSGKLVNQLIPGSGEILLNFKISLLKAALSQKSILLDAAEKDMMPLVELLHHISLRKTIEILDIQTAEKDNTIARQIFGSPLIFGMAQKDALLKQLDEVGTLLIKHVERLDYTTQEQLADFIRYGVYRTMHSSQKHTSSVRIICATQANLSDLVSQKKFCAKLFHELQKTTISMPSLDTLPEPELKELTHALTAQTVQQDPIAHLLTLTDKEQHKIATKPPASLHELKTKVQQLLKQKSTKTVIHQQSSEHEQLIDFDLNKAAQLGKHALKNQALMNMLWQTFKNQNKIATFLGVNRSSVNRRCKEYNLQ